MPNWCGNTLDISGPPEAIALFMLKWKSMGEEFRFEHFVPAPTGVTDRYQWNIDNWGTKWDLESPDVSISDTCISLSFSTAWSPPDAFVAALSRMFPCLAFRLAFEEAGADFAGSVLYKDGRIVEQEQGPCPPSEEEDDQEVPTSPKESPWTTQRQQPSNSTN